MVARVGGGWARVGGGCEGGVGGRVGCVHRGGAGGAVWCGRECRAGVSTALPSRRKGEGGAAAAAAASWAASRESRCDGCCCSRHPKRALLLRMATARFGSQTLPKGRDSGCRRLRSAVWTRWSWPGATSKRRLRGGQRLKRVVVSEATANVAEAGAALASVVAESVAAAAQPLEAAGCGRRGRERE